MKATPPLCGLMTRSTVKHTISFLTLFLHLSLQMLDVFKTSTDADDLSEALEFYQQNSYETQIEDGVLANAIARYVLENDDLDLTSVVPRSINKIQNENMDEVKQAVVAACNNMDNDVEQICEVRLFLDVLVRFLLTLAHSNGRK